MNTRFGLTRFWLVMLLAQFGPLSAAVFTAGPGGAYSTAQSAIDAAIMAAGDDEVRIGGGTFSETLEINPSGAGDKLDVSGGWNTSFVSQGEPSVLDAGTLRRVAVIDLDTDDELILRNLVFRNGRGSTGAGISAVVGGNAILRILDSEIVDNIADSERSEGAGLRAAVLGNSRFELHNSLLRNNQSLCSGTVDCRNGGLDLVAADTATVIVTKSRIITNSVVISSGSGFGGGGSIILFDDSSLIFDDNQIMDNTVTATSAGGRGVGLAISGSGRQTLRRNSILNNTAISDSVALFPQMSLVQFGGQTTILSNTLIAGGNGKGIIAATVDTNATLRLVNLTVTNNANIGVQLTSVTGESTASISNSIISGNGTNTQLHQDVVSSNNLLSDSPGFTDPGADIYTLIASSPAIDAGSAGALDSSTLACAYADIQGLGRAQDANGDGVFECDIGAYELQGGADIGPAQSAAFFDVTRPGEGSFVEILDGGIAVVSFFTYRQDGSGLAWFIGVGRVQGNSVVVDQMVEVSGGVFGAGFDASSIVNTEIGGLSLVFPDCSATSNPGQMAFQTLPDSGYEVLLQNVSRLTAIVNCDDTTTSANAHRSGGFFDIARSGEGIFVQWLSDDRVLIIFYTFDGAGNAFWTISDTSNTTVSGNTVNATMVYAESGTTFGAAFDPDEINFVPWGSVTLEYTDDDNIVFSYNSSVAGFGSGSLNYTRLSQPAGTVP